MNAQAKLRKFAEQMLANGRLERFMAHVVMEITGCWIWNDKPNTYGTFEGQPAHRASWEMFQGPISPGHQVLHGCDMKGCVNPMHLRPGTQLENSDDLRRAKLYGGKTEVSKQGRSRQVNFRVQVEHYDLIRSAAEQSHITVTEYLTLAALHMAGHRVLAQQLTRIARVRSAQRV